MWGGYGGGWGGSYGAWGKGSWGKGGWGGPPQEAIPGAKEAWQQALAPIASEEPELHIVIRDIMKKVQVQVDKYKKDDRLKVKSQTLVPADTNAQAMVEEFVEIIMQTVQGICHEKAWLYEITAEMVRHPLTIIVCHTFSEAKNQVFARTLKPSLVGYVEAGFFKWREDIRIDQAMTRAIASSSIKGDYQQKTKKFLERSYDEAYFHAPYGSTVNDSPELAVMQDFVKGWMSLFVEKSWEILESGLPDTSKDVQVATISSLFQALCDPNDICLPTDIVTHVHTVLGGLPQAPWPYIDEAAAAVFAECEAREQREQAKRARHTEKSAKGKGKD